MASTGSKNIRKYTQGETTAFRGLVSLYKEMGGSLATGAETGRDSLFTPSHAQTGFLFVCSPGCVLSRHTVNVCPMGFNAEQKVDVFPKSLGTRVW